MKVSIENFKSIEKLDNLEIKPISILTGANSIGKTSFIQFILMIKQTLESDFDESQTNLKLNKPYVDLGKFDNIITDNNVQRKLMFKFSFEAKELNLYTKRELKRFKYVADYRVEIFYSLKKINKKIIIDTCRISLKQTKKEDYLIIKLSDSVNYECHCNNSDIFFRNNSFEQNINFDKNDIKIKGQIKFNNLKPHSLYTNNNYLQKSMFHFIMFSRLTNSIFNELKFYFNKISYIGPLRDEPHKYYFSDDEIGKSIGLKGEFAVQILQREAKDKHKVNKFIETDYEKIDTLKFKETNIQLINSVRYWICNIFGMAKSIRTNSFDGNAMTKIFMLTENDKKIPITHVGFGICQVLPIVIQGLRMAEGEMLILEQPEIHLHPNVQAKLFDFLYSLSKQNKFIIIETHSDHLITRMRRRIVEDLNDEISKNVNLIFVEQNHSKGEFKQIEINNMGNFNEWPKDFMNQIDSEYKKIIKAQINKRKKND